jgi:hypothetical protein
MRTDTIAAPASSTSAPIPAKGERRPPVAGRLLSAALAAEAVAVLFAPAVALAVAAGVAVVVAVGVAVGVGVAVAPLGTR